MINMPTTNKDIQSTTHGLKSGVFDPPLLGIFFLLQN
ncbi:MAG: hypothetical protein CEN89_186 [Candidatus Berkelbacteria bacterium Licking1014_7]|uniref:Uncharacterized protein n=1 Tax=Candidatus Berkelbacteria bacterium Licking1014_7 TaxID=2017147 RepID=A0A554LJW9_9BACT|nr:MAG: hypothetical protein CEN89_186 [Candidatus Berkelbacteria bacterium Licking1014_7]